ncbi:DUF5133 domain-containing protein [Streptomyces virginiae]|uniref:DUF5133 domain-containing protein n=1 Tax=Streptomyces virginiae TaxID=1961 RepID=UPI0036F9B7D7
MAVARAVGVLMALVPCTAGEARRILAEVAKAAGIGSRETAEAVLASRNGGPVPAAVEDVLRRSLARARGLPGAPPGSWSPPHADDLRRHVNHLRAARRRALAAPDDAGIRGELEEAVYALCVVMGQRSAHSAVLAAEEIIAVNRLEPRMLPHGG